MIRTYVALGLALRVARYPLQALFIVVVPPLLGPERYGVYAACIALWALAARATDLGTDPLFGRLVPALAPPAAGRLLRQVLWVRLGLAAGPGALLVALLWTPRPEDPGLYLLVVLAVLLYPCQEVLFARLYSEGRVVPYMARDPLASALSVGLVVAGYVRFGLLGAVGAVAAGQALLAALGLLWTRPRPADLAPPRSLAGLAGPLRFGIAASLPATLSVVALKLGTPLLARTGWPAPEVAGFDLAVHALGLAVSLAAYPFVALMPALARQVDGGEEAEARARLAAAVSTLFAGAAGLVAGLVIVGEPLVRWVVGDGFAGLYRNLLVLVGGGVGPVVIAQAAFGLAVLARRPGVVVAPAAVLATLTAAGTLLLAPPLGSFGAALALVAGLAGQAVVLLAVTPGLLALVARPLGAAALAAAPAVGYVALEAAGLLSGDAPGRAAAFALVVAIGAAPFRRLARARA